MCYWQKINWRVKVFNKNIVFLLVAVCSLVFYLGNARAESSEPLKQVKDSVSEIIQIVQDENLNCADCREKRKRLIFKAIDKRFNFPLMAELSLGETWDALKVKERNHFVSLFTCLLQNTYIRRVEGYSGEEVIYDKDIVKGKYALVYSLFVKDNSELSIVNKLRDEGGGQWLIYDVIIEGASVVKQYRRQFAQVIEHEKIDGLMARLEEKCKAISDL